MWRAAINAVDMFCGKALPCHAMILSGLVEPLKAYLEKAKALHREDLAKGYGEVYLPHALERKYPNAGRSWAWQYVFPAASLSVDP